MSSSSWSRLTVMIPRVIGRRNAGSGHFLMTPRRVAMTTNWPSVNSLTGKKACTFSVACKLTRLTIFLPRPATPTSGMSYTLSQ